MDRKAKRSEEVTGTIRLGIDFGTTRIVTAWADRGNYPIVSLEGEEGSQAFPYFPSLVAIRGKERLFGHQAWRAQASPEWKLLRSLKRLLAHASPDTEIDLGSERVPLFSVLVEMAQELRRRLCLSLGPEIEHETLQIMLGVPAHAGTNQRFFTAEAFRLAGFDVLGLVNEPTAASLEFAQWRKTRKQSPAKILVYDLGGGTFDASLVEAGGEEHKILASEGIAELGGDDFDRILAELSLEEAKPGPIGWEELDVQERFLLLEECRQKKEALTPYSRKIVVDLGNVRGGWPLVSVSVEEYYRRCSPLIEKTLELADRLLEESLVEGVLEALYVTGGGSELPLVQRKLREAFGRKVRRSAYARTATAVGLAIAAETMSEYRLRERFHRYFGVWREGEEGKVITFDTLFPKGLELPLPGDPPVRLVRRYRAVHNVGRFRFLECNQLGPDQLPVGDVLLWDELTFPFDPAFANEKDLANVPVRRLEGCSWEIEERYACDSTGTVEVTISNVTTGHRKRYLLGRWARD
ncbi:Hsp70 family protein [Candidatus Methylacidithermus pantelleriae]|uniref:Hsp70 heat shock protein n=1 Tax=Candidatus Methylacidithermus pantelleriae TaxID=2744239 RepID=A0A8J2FWT0_9BACT|nr:Hsp70 family protein [Candidatus Methylacidithermus pantelleriae]CAF0700939.1 Hsp70 heat shock protein [Candidatus Methylacidithermus pantelleriae]